MLPGDVLLHVPLHLATIGAVGALEPRLVTAIVFQVPVQVPLPIEGPRAIRVRADVHPRFQCPEPLRISAPRVIVSVIPLPLATCNKRRDEIVL